jgi:hypothetical protein
MRAPVLPSHAPVDDGLFVRCLHGKLTKAGFDVWFGRANMPDRALTFYQEVADTSAAPTGSWSWRDAR